MKFFGDKSAVSPVMASLVLIIVAIIGALAIGVLMNTFSSQTSDQASAGDVSEASKVELTIGGSTTVTPVIEKAAKEFAKENPVKFDIQATGSGAGIAAAEAGVVDIGMASKPVSEEEHPDLIVHTIGGSGVVVIINKNANTALLNHNFTATELRALYNGSSSTINGVTVNAYERSDESGTEETFAKYLHLGSQLPGVTEGKQGNPGVLAAVEGDENGVGFVDYGFAAKSDKVKMVNISLYDNTSAFREPTKENIKNELIDSMKGIKDNKYYVSAMVRPLNIFTKGQPGSITEKFINYVMSVPEFCDESGYIHISELQ